MHHGRRCKIFEKVVVYSVVGNCLYVGKNIETEVFVLQHNTSNTRDE